jgi:heme A synthase
MPSLEQAHRIAGIALAILTLGLAIWTSSRAGWLALTAIIVEILSVRLPIIHASLAPVFFSAAVALAVLTSRNWQAGPKPVESPWRPLRLVGIGMPVLILLQIDLGVSFRHNALGVIWHILNALIVLVVVLVAGIFVLRQYPEHSGLRPAALAVLIIAGVQVLLGFSVYLVLLMSSENNTGLIVTGVIHVANGALTLAASVVLAMQMQRNLIQSSGT